MRLSPVFLFTGFLVAIFLAVSGGCAPRGAGTEQIRAEERPALQKPLPFRLSPQCTDEDGEDGLWSGCLPEIMEEEDPLWVDDADDWVEQ